MSQKTVQKILFVCRWLPILLCFSFILLVALRVPVVAEQERTHKTVAHIKAQHIAVGDVLGNNLPPVPDQTRNDATLLGIDSNNNGIRDDVELALLASTSASGIRAGELQYARVLQLYLTEVFNKDTWRAVSVQEDRAFQCLGQAFRQTGVKEDDLLPTTLARVADIKNLTFNTQARKDVHEKAMSFITSFGLENQIVCDIDPSTI